MPILGIMASQISGHLATYLGTTWTSGGAMPSTAAWAGLSYGNSIFVVAVDAAVTTAASSPTGVTWTARTLTGGSGAFKIPFGNGIFMAIGPVTVSSSDGITWAATATNGGYANPGQSGAYGLGYFILSNSGTTAAKVSNNNGATWATRTLSAATQSQAGNSSIVVGVTNTGSTTSYSTDATLSTWTTGTLPSSSDWYSTTFGNGLFVTVSYTSGTKAASSTDGISWTARTLPVTASWVGITWAGSNWIAVASSGTNAATSTDAITWTTRTIGTGNYTAGVASSGTAAVAVIYSGSTSQRSTS